MWDQEKKNSRSTENAREAKIKEFGGDMMNKQTWKTGLSSRQDEEGKGIHESSDEFHEGKIKS